ncbi:MAG TPA: sialidase family protein [Verrucomicrobiota bacterium]|nr:sialidase family protein [Verrucomicrobiota bacterium]HNU50761.1 sialidase family protein [Verrucomicrobiota bacterium]
MNPSIKTVFHAFTALLLAPLFPAVSNAQSATHQGDVTAVTVIRRVEQHPQAGRLWQPFIIQGEKRKQLIVAFGAMAHGKKDMGDILASLSRDDGQTWETPVAIFDHNQRQGAIQFAYANPVLYRAPGQDVIWCFAMRCPIAFDNSEESQLVGAFSADGGRSWTPVEMAMHYTGPLILNAGIVEAEFNGQRRFLLPAHRNTLQKDPRGSRDHFILSSTSLLEWKLDAFIPQPTNAGVFLHEGNLAAGDAPGELKIVMRTANYDQDELTTEPPRAYSSVSKDGGRTWSVAREEPDLHNAKSKGFFGRAANGTHIYVYNDGPAQRDKTPEFPNGGRMSLRYKTKPPGGAWSAQKTFFDAGIKNSYPTLIEVAPGEFRAVWDSGTADTPRTHIHFGKLTLKP